MKPEQTVLRPLPGRSGLDPNYYPAEIDAHREAAGLLPFPPLAKVALGASAALGLAAIGLIGKMLGWW
jgi:hypothetical protein